MQTLLKILLIGFVLILGGGILGLMKESRGNEGYGPLGVVIGLAFMAGIKAIWSYGSPAPPTEEHSDSDKLDKS
jgi:hypothetical protein